MLDSKYRDGVILISCIINKLITIIIIRWMYHHSMLDSKYGDGVILGASRVSQLEENVDSSQQGPLNEQV